MTEKTGIQHPMNRRKGDRIDVPFCKTMNCVAQGLCRQKDSWWKTQDNDRNG